VGGIWGQTRNSDDRTFDPAGPDPSAGRTVEAGCGAQIWGQTRCPVYRSGTFNVQRSTLNVQWGDRKGAWWAGYGDRHGVTATRITGLFMAHCGVAIWSVCIFSGGRVSRGAGDEVEADISQPGGAEISDQRANAPRLCASGNFGSGCAGLGNMRAVMVGSKPFARRMRGCFARVHGAIPSPSAIRETLSAYQPLPAQPVSLASTLQVCLDITRDRTSSASRPINGPKQFRPPEPSVPPCGETAKKRTQGRQGGGSNPCAGRWGRRRASEAPAARAKLHPHPPIPPVSLQSQISSMAHAACRQ
jgi:hypothetical protein